MSEQTEAQKKATSESKKAAGKPNAAPLSQPADPREREDMGPLDNSIGDEGVTTTTANEVAQAAGLQSANSEKHLALVDAPGPDGKTVKVETDDNGLVKTAVYERYLQKQTDVTPLYRLIAPAGRPMDEVAREALRKADAAK